FYGFHTGAGGRCCDLRCGLAAFERADEDPFHPLEAQELPQRRRLGFTLLDQRRAGWDVVRDIGDGPIRGGVTGQVHGGHRWSIYGPLTVGWPSARHWVNPPARLVTWSNPAFRNRSRATALRFPDRHTTTIS